MTKAKDDTRTQRQKFIDAAKEHGADGNKEAFRDAVRKVAANVIPKDKAIKKSK